MATPGSASSDSAAGAAAGTLAMVPASAGQPVRPSPRKTKDTPGSDLVPAEADPWPHQGARFRCCFDCGPPRPRHLVSNRGSAEVPSWICGPCNGAKKAIEAIAAKDPGTRKALAELKKFTPEEYKAKVRAARMAIDDDPPAIRGKFSTYGARSSFLGSWASQVTQAYRVGLERKQEAMNKKQFIAWLRYKQGEDVDTQEQKDMWWNKALASPGVTMICATKGQEVIIVESEVSLMTHTERTVKQAVIHSKGLENKEDTQSAMASCATVGTARASGYSGVFEGFAPSLKPGAAFSMADNFIPPVQPVVDGVVTSVPEATDLIQIEDFEPWGNADHEEKRVLKASDSDPLLPKSKKKRTAGPKSLAAGPLKEAREEAAKVIHKAMSQFGTTTRNLGAKVKSIQGNPQTTTLIPEAIMELAGVYEDSLQKLLAEKLVIPTWTMSTLDDKRKDILDTVSKLEAVAVELTGHLNTVKEALDNKTRERMANIRSASAKSQGATAPYMGKPGTPITLIRWVYTKGGVPQESPEGQPEKPVLQEGQPAAPAPLPLGHPVPKWVHNLAWNPKEADFSHRDMAVWDTSAEAGSSGASVATLPSCYAGELADKKKDILEFLAKARAAWQIGQPALSGLASKRQAAEGGQRDTLQRMEWAPSEWRKHGSTPDALSTFGAPWLFASEAGATRSNWVVPGVGQFLVQMEGTSILIAFPLKEAVELGNSMAAASEWATSLKLPTLMPWADIHFRAATLEPRCVAWVPYGYCAYLVASVEGPTVTLAAPYFSTNIMKHHPMLVNLVKYNLGYIKERASREPYKSLGTAMMDWLKGNLNEEQLKKLDDHPVLPAPVIVNGAPQPPAALEDEQKSKDNQKAAEAAEGDIQ